MKNLSVKLVAIIVSLILLAQPVAFAKLKPAVKNANKQITCLAKNIYHEARSESFAGRQAVAFVTMNRVKSEKFPSTVCKVVNEKTSTGSCQFSWKCQDVANKPMDKKVYDDIFQTAINVYKNHEMLYDISRGALFYHATYVDKSAIGVKNLRKTVKIGRHVFYKV